MTNPKIIVEVLSPSTEKFDRGDKWGAYQRMPVLPDDEPIRIVSDWVCEVLTKRTRAYVQQTKKPFYARVGVEWLWYVDLDAQTFTVSRLHNGKWLE